MSNAYRETVFKIIAGARAGLIAFSCDRCKSADAKDEKDITVVNYVKKSLGCNEMLDVPGSWFDTGDDDAELFFNCPLKFICLSVKMFFEKYDLQNRKIVSLSSYENESAKYLEGINYYEKFLDKYTKIVKGE